MTVNAPTPPERSPFRRPPKAAARRHYQVRPMDTMTLNPTSEPADPNLRRELHLPFKSYADAVEINGPSIDHAAQQALDSDDKEINEDLIKESPPRHHPGHLRTGSSPRPLGEIMDESEGPPPGSPSLRHPRGRLEEKGSRDTYAGVGKQPAPGDARPRTPNGQTNGHVHGNGVHNHTSPGQSSTGNEADIPDDTSDRTLPRSYRQVDGVTVEKSAAPGQLVIENLRSKSGENLASIVPSQSYLLGLQQQEDKLPTQADPQDQKLIKERRHSELVSGRRAGAGWGRSAIRWAPLNVPLQRRLQMAMVLLHSLSVVGLLAFFFLLCTIPLLWPILVPYLLYLLLSRAHIDGNLRHQSKWMRSSKVWSLFAGYFPARLHRSAVLEPTRKYIFGYHPHGIISHGAYAAFATDALGFSQLFPGISNTLLTLDSNFRVPLYRDFALRMGLASVSRESCENILGKGGPNGEGMGRAITIVVGGARESLDAKPNTLRLVLNRRKGFVKLAIRTGADLVPVLSFGENDLYDQFDATSHPYVHKAQMLVKKFMGFTVPLFHARGVFNYDVGMMPYRRPVNIVVGRPIRILQNKTPDPAYVDEIHARYVEELLRLWEDWRGTFARGMAYDDLKIVE